MLRLRPEAGYTLEINIGIRLIGFVTADLLGKLRQSGSISLPFQDEPDWHSQFQGALPDFFRQYQIDPSQILGAGIKIRPQLDALTLKAAQYDQFARDINYIFPCVQQEYSCALGAAQFGLEQFGDKLLHRAETAL